jgi:phage FluMu protein Com
MYRANCRCGQLLEVNGEGMVRVVCPRCKANVRVRVRSHEDAPSTVPAPEAAVAGVVSTNMPDPYIRFYCPCGRRLKVLAADYHPHGKCPECGRIVSVPPPPVPAYTPQDGVGTLGAGHPEMETAELEAADLEIHRIWCRAHLSPQAWESEGVESDVAGSSDNVGVSITRAMDRHQEEGLQVCTACREAFHMRSDRCTRCGEPVASR